MPMNIRFHEQGGPDVLTVEDVPTPAPGRDEVLLRQTAIGVNYLDVYFRNGHFEAPSLPMTTGFEGAGIVEAVGDGVEGFEAGDRVAYQLAMGGYEHYRTVPSARCVRLPDSVSDEQAAAMMLKGTTAEFLANQVRRPAEGDTVLVHAASGGVGSILTQWLTANGATVIATVGSDDKARRAQARGAGHAINYRDTDFVEAVNALTGGHGVDYAYDGVGRDTFARTFGCLAPFGTNILFGWSSGRVGAIDVDALNGKSHEIVNPSLGHYTGTRERLLASAEALFAAVESGAVEVQPAHRYPLSQAGLAHRDLEARNTYGPIVLIPD